MTTDILLIRAGMTDYEHQGRVQGRLDLPLNSEGRQQVVQLVEQLASELPERSLSTTFHGPGTACTATAEAVARATGSRLKKVDLLQNVDLGLWQGKLIEEIKSQQPKTFRLWQEKPESVCPPEGEMLSEARQRVADVLPKLIGKKSGGLIAIVVPEPMATLVAWEVTKQQPAGMLWTSSLEGRRWELIKRLPEPLVTR